jgi:ubiquinone/menaquinone biosynthesis C-methylase UbiE
MSFLTNRMFINPEKSIAQLGLLEGMRVADFGAGTGAYSKAISQKVGYSGKVFAIEVQKDLVKKLENEIRLWGITNIECIWGDIEKKGGTKLADHSMDRVVVSNVLFQAEDKIGLIDEVRRILKKDGEVLLIDWTDSYGGMGPSPENIITQNTAKELFEKRNFKFLKNISTTMHHYGIIFKYE